MEDVKTIDINGVQWSIKDQKARDEIVSINTQFTPKRLDNIPISIKSGYSATGSEIRNIVQYGKLYAGLIRLSGVKGDYIGSATSAQYGKVNIKPVSIFSAVGLDYVAGRPVRIEIDQDGNFIIAESTGVTNGSNIIFIQVFWIEA